jgi:hypothetical protein
MVWLQDFLPTISLEKYSTKCTITHIFDVAPDGVSLGEAVELGEGVDGAQPGMELTELPVQNHYLILKAKAAQISIHCY